MSFCCFCFPLLSSERTITAKEIEKRKVTSNEHPFSTEHKVDQGAYLENEKIIFIPTILSFFPFCSKNEKIEK